MRVPKGDFRWDCDSDLGCYVKNGKLRFSVFDGCFPRGCNFGDVDGIVEIDGRFLLLEWKRPSQSLDPAQRLTLQRLTRGSDNIEAIVCWGDPATMRVERWQAVAWGEFGIVYETGLEAVKGYIRRWSGLDSE